MGATSIQNQYSGLSRLKLFFALSRTPHGLLDMTTPVMTALLWLGSFPPLRVVAWGIITSFAGYTAVYALNDLIDYRIDREKMSQGDSDHAENYLDAVMVRHPVAQGFLSFKEALLWVVAWSLLALVGAYILNPVCVLIFMVACTLETIYCLMLKVSHLRTIVSGAVKTSAGMAAIFAVDPNPSPTFLVFLFLWLFFWEIGGQNVPADWTDIEEDKSIQARTIPVQLGPERANAIILGSLIIAVILNVFLFWLSRASFNLVFVAGAFCLGVYLLLIPAYRLFKTKGRRQALLLFNRASYYPATLLFVVILKAII